MTSCEENGWKVGDKFKIIGPSRFDLGEIVELVCDDGSECPLFRNDRNVKWYVSYGNIEKIEEMSIIDAPLHYNQGEVECIVAIKASMTPSEFQGYLKGNAMKYLWRMGLKGKPLVDVQKAQWYVNKLVEELNAEAK